MYLWLYLYFHLTSRLHLFFSCWPFSRLNSDQVSLYVNQFVSITILQKISFNSSFIKSDFVTLWVSVTRCRILYFLKKIYWGPRRATIRNFAIITLDPLYFEVHIFSNPLNPPICLENAKMCYFEYFFGVRWKKTPQSRGPPWKI